jgi:hypothetical protein
LKANCPHVSPSRNVSICPLFLAFAAGKEPIIIV